MAVGAVGEFAPIIAMTLFLDGRRPGQAMVYLTAFALIAGGRDRGRGARRARRGEPVGRPSTMETSGQFAVRLVIALLMVMIGATVALGVDMLLGAFAAGVIIRILFHSGAPERTERVTAKLEAVGFGFLIPVFFIEHRDRIRPEGADLELGHARSGPAVPGAVPGHPRPAELLHRAGGHESAGPGAPSRSTRPPGCR